MEKETETKDVEPQDDGRRKRIAVIAGGVAVVLLAAGLTWWGVATHGAKAQLAQAQESCQQASADYANARNKYADTLNGKSVTGALKIDAKQVKDAKTVTALAKDSKAKTPETVACPTAAKDKAEVETATAKLKDATDWYTTHAKILAADAGKVNDSKDAKTLDTAKTSLNKKLETARKLYDSSKDKVADSKTRDALKKQIDEANKVKAGTDAKKINDAASSLQKAIDGVNKSVKAKIDADAKAAEAKSQAEREAAAAQAAQEAANAQAQQQTQSQQSYTPTYTQTQQTTPQYTAPQQAQPQQSTPKTQSDSGNSGSSNSNSGGVVFNRAPVGSCENTGGCTGTYDGFNHNGF
ncbi:MAG: colicin transporter [Bifidobacterium choerinum]